MFQTDDAVYTDLIIDLSRHPLNNRSISDADITNSGVNSSCGDHLRIYLKLDLNPSATSASAGGTAAAGEGAKKTAAGDKTSGIGQSTVLDASFEGSGCAISVATACLLTEEIRGKTLDEAMTLTKEHLFEWLGTPLGPSRVKCGTLSLETLQEGIRRFMENSLLGGNFPTSD